MGSMERIPLTDTTHSDPLGQRKTFVYLNPLLYPLYIQLPPDLKQKNLRHQFVIFAPDEQLKTIKEKIETVRDLLGLSLKDVARHLPNAKSEQAKVMVENLGEIVTAHWQALSQAHHLVPAGEK